MEKNIQEIEGIGTKYADLLSLEGIKTTTNLLEVGGKKSGRKMLAEKTSISESSILKWVNMCDLFRIKGVADQYAELLEGAGVDTVRELRNRNAANLAKKMTEVNNMKHICKSTPGVPVIARWIEQAKVIEPMVFH